MRRAQTCSPRLRAGVRHEGAQDLDNQGPTEWRRSWSRLTLLIFLPALYRLANTLQGVNNWGAEEWMINAPRINAPRGGPGTFNLALADHEAYTVQFRFYWPRIFD